MLVPTTFSQPAVPAVQLIPIEITAAGPPSGVAGLAGLSGTPASVFITVRRRDLNVLANHASTIAGDLLADRGSTGLRGSSGLRGSTGLPGRRVTLQALGARGWSPIASTLTGGGGRFRVRYVSQRTGSEPVRLRFAGDGVDRGARRALGRMNVYRTAAASWYGGGGTLACGGELTGSTMGVANKTLPCGTLVTLRYGDRTVRVPVIDRGPYVAGREFDLTEATKRALGFGSTGEVWSTR
jgi:peptidoglycan lytic transglycosylase